VEVSSLGSGTMTNETDYTYDSHNQLSIINTRDSKGAMWTHQYFHNYDYNTTAYSATCTGGSVIAPTIATMNSNNLQVVLAEEKRKNGNWPTTLYDSVTSFTQWLPSYSGGFFSLNSSASSTLSKPVASSVFHSATGGATFNMNSFYCYDANMGNITEMTKYDDHQNIIEAWSTNHTRCASNIWDTRIGKKVASVANAQYAQVAYCSFEGSFAPYGTADYNKGNWDFVSSNIVLGPAMTGRYYLQFNSSGIVSTITPTIATPYLISFWCSGSVPNVNLVSRGTSTPVSMTSQVTVGSWTLYTGYFTGNGVANIDIENPGDPGGGIDELRMIPANAIISTCTYEPFMGVSSQSDERNNITYYNYDAMGRLSATRDINGNIIQLNTTVVQGHD
jgi:YD repeat-containing protein